MTNEAKEYYKGFRRVMIGGVPCRVRADTKGLQTVAKLTTSCGNITSYSKLLASNMT